jgi:hypothetical protein
MSEVISPPITPDQPQRLAAEPGSAPIIERVQLKRNVRLKCGTTLVKGSGWHDVKPGTNIALDYQEEIPKSAIRDRISRPNT